LGFCGIERYFAKVDQAQAEAGKEYCQNNQARVRVPVFRLSFSQEIIHNYLPGL
jgi:hypothetical protein